MGRGRNRKQNVRREPNGRAVREPRFVTACEGVIRRQLIYGGNKPGAETYDAIGRAWTAGLLGYNAEGKRDAARNVAAQYRIVYGIGLPSDSLARYQPQAGGSPDPSREKIRRDMLDDALEMVRKRGYDVRVAFDELVIEQHPDSGPLWLDRIIFARNERRTPREHDTYKLRLAIEGITVLA